MLAIFCTSSKYGDDRMQVFCGHIADYLHSVGDQIIIETIANLKVAQRGYAIIKKDQSLHSFLSFFLIRDSLIFISSG